MVQLHRHTGPGCIQPSYYLAINSRGISSCNSPSEHVQSGDMWRYPAGILLTLPFYYVWTKGDIGAGDVKLIADCGFYLGLTHTLLSFVFMLPIDVVQLLRQLVKGGKNRMLLAPIIAARMIGSVLYRKKTSHTIHQAKMLLITRYSCSLSIRPAPLITRN